MTNNYDKLYESVKNRFTVVNNNKEYTLGDYMLMKAGKKREESNLPVAHRSTAAKGERAVAMIASYVNDKLIIKEPPVKDKTIHRFPFRASASAFLSAMVACSFVLCFGIIGATLLKTATPVADSGYIDEINEELKESSDTTSALFL